MSIYTGQTPRELYRSFFRHIRHIPDPHVWSILQPRFRHLLEKSSGRSSTRAGGQNQKPGQAGSGDESESSARGALRAARARKNAEDELRGLQAAASCYPHALRRLLAKCYGRTGSVRWQLINVRYTFRSECSSCCTMADGLTRTSCPPQIHHSQQ